MDVVSKYLAREWLWFVSCWIVGGLYWAATVSADLVPAMGGGLVFGLCAYAAVGFVRLTLAAARASVREW